MKRFMILLFLGFSAVAAAQLQGPACESGQTCRPGDVINVGADAASISLGASYSVKLNASKGTVVDASAVAISAKVSKATDCARPAASVKDTPVGFCVVLPGKIADDTYTIQIKPTSAKPGDSAIDISPPQVVVQQPSIAAVSPAGAFAEADGTNSLDILGSGFLRGQDRAVRPEDRKEQDKHVTLRFTEIGTPALCPDAGTLPAAGCYSLTVDSDKQVTLAFHKINAGSNLFGGKKSFVIAVDGVDTNESALTLIPTSAGMPKTVAVVGFLVIVLVVFLLLRGGEGATKRTLNKKDYWLSVLFFDMQTNSYSLSKCQFYAWTGAAILGYLYLAVSKSFIQGSGAFPDIPPGLPGILMASVGTVVVSNGITSAKGNKGAGNPGPNLSDFIASGGVVAPDRLQFAIWTIIGIGTFLSIVFQSDPRNLTDLPTIPSGFLQLMGISSAGYLAGKLARKPGPTLAAINVRYLASANTMRFELTGSGLSKSAMFSIDDAQIFPDPLFGDTNQKGPQILKADPSITDPDFGSVLTFTVPNPPDTYLGEHNFTITNPDAQKAVESYQVFQVKKITVSRANLTITIDGACLDKNLTVQCSAGGTANPVEAGSSCQHFVWKLTNALTDATTAVTVTVKDSAGSTVEVRDIAVGA